MNNTDYRSRLLERVTPPALEPVSLSAAKGYLRVEHDDEDELIADLITAARMMAENWLRRSLIEQVWKLVYDDYLPMQSGLPMGPVQQVIAVNAIDIAGGVQAIDDEAYKLNSARNTLVLNQTVYAYSVEIRYKTGYGSTAGDVPAPIRQGLLSHIADMYENRGDGMPGLPAQAEALYMPFREVLL